MRGEKQASKRCLSSKSRDEPCDECQSELTEPSVAIWYSTSESREESKKSVTSEIHKLPSAESCLAVEEVHSASVPRAKTTSNIDQRTIKVLITGKSGNSKSVIINGLAGQCLIPERKGVVLHLDLKILSIILAY